MKELLEHLNKKIEEMSPAIPEENILNFAALDREEGIGSYKDGLDIGYTVGYKHGYRTALIQIVSYINSKETKCYVCGGR